MRTVARLRVLRESLHLVPYLTMSITLEYDAYITESDDPECLVSTLTCENFNLLTENALPWGAAPDSDQSRRVVASIWLESLVREARGGGRHTVQPGNFLFRLLDVEWVVGTLDVMVDQGLICRDWRPGR